MIARISLPHALLVIAGMTAVSSVEAQEVRIAEEGAIEIDFQHAELGAVITALADAAGITVIYSSLPPTPVTVRTSGPVSVDQVADILRGIIEANDLAAVEDGGVMRISARRQSPQPMPGAAGEAYAELLVYRLRHGQAEPLAATIRDVFGLAGGAQPSPGRRPSLSQELAGQRLDTREITEPSGREGAARVAPMQAGLEGPVQIVAEPLTNSLLMRGTPADLATISAAVEQLDTRPLQVLIEVVIAEVRRDDRLELGVDWHAPETPIGDGRATASATLESSTAGDFALRLLHVGGIEGEVVLRALASRADVRILSRPLALAQNNQEARILVGSERPFIQLFRALPTDGAVRDQIVQYRNVGTQLTIRPTINDDGYVTLYVLQEVSTATAEVQFGAPVISTREAETQLLVRDGHTAVIGGLIDQQHERGDSGIPLLRSIPIIGALFRSTQRRRGTTELFVLLTPHVIRTDAEMLDTYEELRDSAERLPELLPPLRDDDADPPGDEGR